MNEPCTGLGLAEYFSYSPLLLTVQMKKKKKVLSSMAMSRTRSSRKFDCDFLLLFFPYFVMTVQGC